MTMGRPGAGGGARICHLCQILALFLDIPGQLWAAQICATNLGGADSSRPIGAAAVLPAVRGIFFPCLRLSHSQLQTCAGYRTGRPAGLPVPAQVKTVLPIA